MKSITRPTCITHCRRPPRLHAIVQPLLSPISGAVYHPPHKQVSHKRIDVTCLNFCAEARDRLRKLREDHLRRSDEVVELWEDVLDCVHYKLGTECMYFIHFRYIDTRFYIVVLNHFVLW